jgi:hypothetical protein
MIGSERKRAASREENLDQKVEKIMFNKARIALSVAVVLGTASSAIANNHASQYGSPDSTPNGPFFYVDTYGVPPAMLRQVQQPRRPPHKHN